jgi:hypothetical protein
MPTFEEGHPMKRRFKRLSLALAVGVCLGTAASLPAEEYRDPERHFSFTLPADWQPMPTLQLDLMNRFAASQSQLGNVHYDAGYQQSEQRERLTPYLLVQWFAADFRGRTYDQIEDGLSRELKTTLKKVEGALDAYVKDIGSEGAFLDRGRNRLILRFKMTNPGVGTIRGHTVGHIGQKGILYIHCYALDDEFDALVPTFNQINDSFRYEPGFEFVPGRSGFDISKIGRAGLIGGIIGGVGSLIAGVFYKLTRRRPAPQHRQTDEETDAVEDNIFE